MNYKQEINTLLAETVAMQAVLAKVLSQLRAADPHLASLIAAGLNDAANQVEDIAIKFGAASSPEHTVRAIRVVEELRCPSRKSYPHIAMVQSGKNWRGDDRSAPLDSSP
jgi:hypothetical protein